MNRVLFIIALGLLAIVGGPVATLCLVFLLPSIVAHLIRHPDTKLVMLVNLTVGWTVLGWAIAAALTMPCKTRTRDRFPNADVP